MKNIILSAFIALLCCSNSFAQSGSYNFQSGWDAFEKKDYATAIHRFTASLQDLREAKYVPYYFIAVCYNELKEYGKAMQSVNNCIDDIPRKEKSYMADALRLRGNLHAELGDTTGAISDLERAMKLDQNNYAATIFDLCGIYIAQNNVKKAFALAHKAAQTHPNDSKVLTILTLLYRTDNKYEEALTFINKAIQLEKQNPILYQQRSDIYYKMGKYIESADDLIQTLNLKEELNSDINWSSFNDEAYPIVRAKLKVQQNADEYNYKWPHYLGMLELGRDNYEEALAYFTQANDIQPNAVSAYNKSWCLNRLGRYNEALREVDKYLRTDENELRFISFRADLLQSLGRYDEAIEQYTKVIKRVPNWSAIYSQRAWAYYHNKEFKKALDDYDVAIVLNAEPDPHDYLHRGRSYQRLGRMNEAKADFQRVIELDNNPVSNHALPYAYIGLGNYPKAVEAIEERIKVEKSEAYYDGACVYSLVNDKAKAIVYLRLALQNGYNNFNHIARDFDLDNIRETEDFKELIKTFNKAKAEEIATNAADTDTTTRIIETIGESRELRTQDQHSSSRVAFSNRTYAGDAGGTVVATTGMMVGGTSHDANAGRGTIGGRGTSTGTQVVRQADTEIYSESCVATMAQFPGGEGALIAFMNKTVKYPQIAIEQDLQGTVYLRFVAAIAALKKAPRFAPARNVNGEPVRVWFNLPVKFQIGYEGDSFDFMLRNHNATKENHYLPHFTTYSNTSCRITKVETSAYCTAIQFEFINNRSEWCCINPQTFLIQHSKKLKMIKATGIPLSPNRHYFSRSDEKITFTLYFPALEYPNSPFDIIEEGGNSPWKFYNIKVQ